MSRAKKFRENIKKEARQEAAKMKEMSWKDRLWYIGEYYRYSIMGALFVIALLAVAGFSLYNRSLTMRLYVIVLNNPAVLTENFSPLTRDYAEARAFGKKDRIYAESISLPTDGSIRRGDAMTATGKIAALISAQKLDIMIADPIAFESYSAADTFLNLETVLPEDLQNRLKDRLLLSADQSGVPLLQKMNIVTEKPCLSIIANSANIGECIALIRYLFPS